MTSQYQNIISFVMPAKNASRYVGQAIKSLCDADDSRWELIVIDDHSTDDTYDIVMQFCRKNERVKIFKNIQEGKVAALNEGYVKASGNIIKCIDADDVLGKEFFDCIDLLKENDAFCHDLYITNEFLNVIGVYSLDPAIVQNDFNYCLKYLKSMPRCSWTFSRDIGNKIFPMPADLPFEDTWFSLIIKKYSKKMCYLNKKLYYYRQHGNQVYGGILNFKKDTVIFRANRILKLIEIIKNEPTNRLLSNTDDKGIFEEIELFYALSAKNNLRIIDIIKADLPFEFKLKLTIYRKLSFLASIAVRLKWAIDNLKSNLHAANS